MLSRRGGLVRSNRCRKPLFEMTCKLGKQSVLM
jgi:hypothetical protein